MEKEKANITAKGEYVDYIYKNGELVEVKEGHNIVVNCCSKLIASLIAGKTSSGALYWAIGSGNSDWDALYDANNPPAPTEDAVQLVNEIARISLNNSNFKFVDESGNEVSDMIPTNRIKCTISVGEEVANGKWREFGLFGGGTASPSSNTGIMIDHVYHNVFNKSNEFSVTRVLTLTF